MMIVLDLRLRLVQDILLTMIGHGSLPQLSREDDPAGLFIRRWLRLHGYCWYPRGRQRRVVLMMILSGRHRERNNRDKRVLQACCSTGMPFDNDRSQHPMAPHDEAKRSRHSGRGERNVSMECFVPIILWPTMACTSLSNDEHGRHGQKATLIVAKSTHRQIAHQAGVRTFPLFFFVLCWRVALPEAALSE